MKRFIKLFSIGVAFFLVVSIGTWMVSQTRTENDLLETRAGKCDESEEDIARQIADANYCRTDEECRAIDIGCPWGAGKDGCRAIFVNRNHSVSLLQNDARSFRFCIDKDEKMKSKYSCTGEFYERGKGCTPLQDIKLKCVDNKCVEDK